MTSRPPSVTAELPAARIELCLDYVNTRFWRGSDAPEETLGAPPDLLAWLAGTAHVPASVLAEAGDPAPLLAPAIAVRETIHRLFDALGRRLAGGGGRSRGPECRPGRGAPARGAGPGSGRFRWALRTGEVTPPVLLAPVLWSAGDLLASAAQHRIRRCANEKCRWLFLDRSKAGTRRWCDMAACGNRAKAQRHYARSKGG